ncbi:hypothetical protein [Rhodoglobus sp.]
MDVARQNIRASQTLVLCGEDTFSSVSGREYTTADGIIRAEEIITIDLSSERDGFRGDFARTIIVENSSAIEDARLAARDDWRAGVLAEAQLHSDLIEQRSTDRIYLEKGNAARIGDTALFTFAPHIRRPGRADGFKHENSYYFTNDRLVEL